MNSWQVGRERRDRRGRRKPAGGLGLQTSSESGWRELISSPVPTRLNHLHSPCQLGPVSKSGTARPPQPLANSREILVKFRTSPPEKIRERAELPQGRHGSRPWTSQKCRDSAARRIKLTARRHLRQQVAGLVEEKRYLVLFWKTGQGRETYVTTPAERRATVLLALPVNACLSRRPGKGGPVLRRRMRRPESLSQRDGYFSLLTWLAIC